MNRQEIPFSGELSKDSLLSIEQQKIFDNVDQHLTKISFLHEDLGEIEKTNLKDMVMDMKGKGKCYLLSYFYCLFDENYKMTQGICSVVDQGYFMEFKKEKVDYVDREHSWCESEDFVYDPSWGNKVMKKEQFYKKYKIEIDSVSQYSSAKATEELIEHGIFDYWRNCVEKSKDNDEYFLGKTSLNEGLSTLCNNISSLKKLCWYGSNQCCYNLTLKLKGERKQFWPPKKK